MHPLHSSGSPSQLDSPYPHRHTPTPTQPDPSPATKKGRDKIPTEITPVQTV